MAFDDLYAWGMTDDSNAASLENYLKTESSIRLRKVSPGDIAKAHDEGRATALQKLPSSHCP